jgi:hypothetical protein
MKKLGKRPRRHYFFLNPYRDARFSYCPKCEGKTRLRKFPLVIHVEPLNPVALNKTCRYCPGCDLIIAHQDEIEAQLDALFAERDPALIGNDYLVMGTIDRAVWRRSLKTPMPIPESLDHLHVFKDALEFEPVHYGWG